MSVYLVCFQMFVVTQILFYFCCVFLWGFVVVVVFWRRGFVLFFLGVGCICLVFVFVGFLGWVFCI